MFFTKLLNKVLEAEQIQHFVTELGELEVAKSGIAAKNV